MMIKTKTESDFEIKRRGLNRLAEGIFTKDTSAELVKFLDTYPYPFYNIRDKSKSMGQFLYKISKEDVLKHSHEYDRFSVYESLCEADKHLLIQGDIYIDDSFEMIATLNDTKCIPLRVAMQNPKYCLSVDLKERREPDIQGLTYAINYIVNHELFNMYVEIAVYDALVGIKKENIIVFELRNY